jgi:hypothetical protein
MQTTHANNPTELHFLRTDMRLHHFLSALGASALCLTMTASPALADGPASAKDAAKACASQADSPAKLKSCCENQTFNHPTEAKERSEAAGCIKLANAAKGKSDAKK